MLDFVLDLIAPVQPQICIRDLTSRELHVVLIVQSAQKLHSDLKQPIADKLQAGIHIDIIMELNDSHYGFTFLKENNLPFHLLGSMY